MFHPVNARTAKNEAGVVVAFVGKFDLQYRSGDLAVTVPIEPIYERGSDRYGSAIEIGAIRHWDEPNQHLPISQEQRAQIQHEIAAALEALDHWYKFQ